MQNNSTSTPHETVFKPFLSPPQTARDFMALHLPLALLATGDLLTRRLASGSFVEDHVHSMLQAGETSDAGAFMRELAQRVSQTVGLLQTSLTVSA